MARFSVLTLSISASLMIGVGASTQAVAAQASAPAADVCALLPAAEATTVLGRKVARARPATRAEGGSECRYTLGLEGTITIIVNAGTPKNKWDAFMNELKASGATLEPAAGVGDGGFFWDTRLYTHVADYEIAINTSPMPGASPQKIRQDALALAKAVVGKLKG